MKNKLVKTNMTRFDYLARRLGIIGFVLFVMCFSVALPIATKVVSERSGSASSFFFAFGVGVLFQ